MSVTMENTNVMIKPLHAATNWELTPASVRKVIGPVSHCINAKVNLKANKGSI